jgi:hypothetical protein
MDCDHLATLGACTYMWLPRYPWSMLRCMLIDDYTSVPSWLACRDHHEVLTSILAIARVGLVRVSISWAYCYGLESYARSYESVIDILNQSIKSS